MTDPSINSGVWSRAALSCDPALHDPPTGIAGNYDGMECVLPGYTDRIVPLAAKAAAALQKRRLTKLPNARPAGQLHAHAALGLAVADADS